MALSLTALGLMSLVASLALGSYLLPVLKRLKFGQVIRSDGPQAHLGKKGTPTMGGVIFLVPAMGILWLVAYLWKLDGIYVAVMSLLVVGFGLIGLADDVLKVVYRRPLGLMARQKIVGQCAIVIVTGILLAWSGHDTAVTIPLTFLRLELGVAYWVFLALLSIGFSNAVNLTDGVDGLAAGTVTLATLGYAFIGVWSAEPVTAVFAAVMSGSLLGFLWYNRHPARVFMGDVGSLALGGGLAAMSIVTKSELLSVLMGAVFVWSALSVVLQVVYFRLTGGTRLFRMSPFHHALELRGWSERQIVAAYAAAGLMCAVLAITIFAGMGG